MSTLITLCRDVEQPVSTDCIEDHEGSDLSLTAPCQVRMEPCVTTADEYVGPEAESSAIFQDVPGIQNC